jgi:hypothetical protein
MGMTPDVWMHVLPRHFGNLADKTFRDVRFGGGDTASPVAKLSVGACSDMAYSLTSITAACRAAVFEYDIRSCGC